MNVSTISTDRHPQIIKEMSISNPEKHHEFDPRHVAKGVSKQKWESVIHHITNRHDWPGNRHFHRCAHEPIDELSERKKLWLSPGSEGHKALVRIVKNKRLSKDLDHLTKCIRTTTLEVCFVINSVASIKHLEVFFTCNLIFVNIYFRCTIPCIQNTYRREHILDMM